MRTYLFSLVNLSRTYNSHLIYSNQLFSYEYELKPFNFEGTPKTKQPMNPIAPLNVLLVINSCVHAWTYIFDNTYMVEYSMVTLPSTPCSLNTLILTFPDDRSA